MYSVIRFVDIDEQDMRIIAQLINEQLPGFCSEICPNTKNKRCFSFSLSSKEVWCEHHEQINTILNNISSSVEKAKELFSDLKIQIDLEVGHPDYAQRLITEIYWTVDLLQLVAK